MSPPEPPSQARAIVAGLAAGDLHGGPLAMARCLARSLSQRQGFVARDVLDRYLAWWREDGDDTGPVAAQVFGRIEDGAAPEEAVLLTDKALGGLTAGVNPAHRAGAILALASFLPDDELVAIAHAEAALTHAHPLAGGTSAAMAVLCRQLLRGATWAEALATAAAASSPEIATALLAPDAPCSPGGFSPHALTAAIVLVGGTAGPAEALAASFRFAGRANYAPVLVGALAGARWWPEALQAWPPADVPEFEALVRGWVPQESLVSPGRSASRKANSGASSQPFKGRTYPVSESLGSLLETYLVDGLSDGDPEEPELGFAHLVVVWSWDRERDLILVRNDHAEILWRGMTWALNSIGDEPHTDRVKANLVRSGDAFASKLIRQADEYRRALKAKTSTPTS